MSKTNQPHPRAELMLQYAQDAMETDKPYERWQYRHLCRNHWLNLKNHPDWENNIIYRRKPETVKPKTTVMVNGSEVVAPMSIVPLQFEFYWIADPTRKNWSYSERWLGMDKEKEYFERGLCFETEEDAIAYAKAMVNYQEP